MNALRRLRKARGLSQIQLAKKARTRQSHISRLETGTWTATLPTLAKLAKALSRCPVTRTKKKEVVTVHQLI